MNRRRAAYADVYGHARHPRGEGARHEADVKVQGKYGVDYRQYWVDEENGKVFCLVEAPDRETATRVHREAHGLEAHTLFKVEQGA